MTIATAKLTLGDFTVEFLGIEFPDYFQGYGLGPSSEYTDCCYGIGSTEAEALEDCLEMMAQSGHIDLDDETEKRIRDEYGKADDNVTAADEIGCTEDEESEDGPYPHWYIGIKWSIREEQRLERIREIQDIQPLRYENYTRVNPSKRCEGLWEWGYERRADGSASYGDFHDDDWPESAKAYFGALSDDILDTEERYFYVPYASGSDYSGSTVEKANAKCIEDAFGEHDWVHPVYGGYNTYAVALGLTGLLTCDEDTFDEVCETLEGLTDYPVIDEEALYKLEAEGADEAWESWGRDDFTRALEKEFEKFEDEVEFDWPDDPEFRTFFEEKREKANEYWFNEGSGPDMYVRLDEVVEGITFDDVVKWAIQYEVSYCDLGEKTEIYYNEDDAKERVVVLRGNGIIGASYKVLETESDG